MLKMVDGTGIIGVDMICPLGVSTPQPPNYDRVELEGAGMLVLPNSLDAPLERLELGGKTAQVTTTGAQLFDIDKFLELPSVEGGLGRRRELVIKLKPTTKYTMSSDIAGSTSGSGAVNRCLYFSQATDNGLLADTTCVFNNHSITQISDGEGHLKITLFDRSIAESIISRKNYVMLNEGSAAQPYEPYTGNKPSPSPEYPQEIKNSGKWNEETQKYEVDVKITGKNLFDMNKFIDTCNFTKNEDGTFIIDKHVERYDCFIPANTILSIEVLKVEDSSGAAALELFYEDGKNMYIGFGQVGVKTFLIQKDVVYIKVLAYRKHEYKYIQLEKGNTATPYEPYKEQTLTLTSDRPITKWDRLVEQGGQIGWLYRSEIITLTGDEHYVAYSDFNSFYTSIPALNRNGNTPFCNKYVHKSIVSSNLDKVFSVGDGSYDKVWFRDMRFNLSISDFKSYLQDEYSKGTPVEVVCTTKETEFVPLPQSEQNAIRALKTYYPTTVITADGGEVDPDIKVTYRKEI